MAETYLTLTNKVIARLNEVALTSTTFSSARGIQVQCQNAGHPLRQLDMSYSQLEDGYRRRKIDPMARSVLSLQVLDHASFRPFPLKRGST